MLDTDLEKDTQVIDSNNRRCIENPRVGGSIPPLGTILQTKKWLSISKCAFKLRKSKTHLKHTFCRVADYF